MHPRATNSFTKDIASALTENPAPVTAACFDLAKLIPPSATMRTTFEHLEESESFRAKIFDFAESPILRTARELSALPRIGAVFGDSLAARSEALFGIGNTIRKLMNGIQFQTPQIGACVMEMQARTAAIAKTMEGFRFPTINLSPEVMDVLTKGLAAPRFTEGLGLARLALDFPKLTAGFHQFLLESQIAQERLVEPLVAIPPRELFLAGDVGLAFEHAEATTEEAESEREALRAEIDDYIQPTLEIVLVRFKPSLVELWRGAREASVARRSDCARHVLISLRELFREVLLCVAPDDDVRAWSNNSSDLCAGKPTRSARVRYALRHLRSPSLTKFLELDQKGVGELFDLFNQGTHGVDPPLTPLELPFIVRRVEGFLCALVEAHEIGDDSQ